jgi:hypothetical protein
VPIDPLTIVGVLTFAALKKFQGSGGDSLTLQVFEPIVAHLTGTAAHGDVKRAREEFTRWFNGPSPDKNFDLEKAVTRSAIHADLFCIIEALGDNYEPLGSSAPLWLQRVWERCPESLKTSRPMPGFITAGMKLQLRAAKDACEKRLEELEEDFKPAPIDSRRLIDPSSGGEYGEELAASALEALEADHGAFPIRVRDIVMRHWFYYLCGSFHQEIKHNDAVFRIFLVMYQSARFDRVESTVRDEGQKIRDHIDRVVTLHAPRSIPESLPHHGLVLEACESPNGIVIWLRNPGTAALEGCRVVLCRLDKWSVAQGTFVREQAHSSKVLLSCAFLAGDSKSDSAYLVMINRSDKSELLVEERVPGGSVEFLTKEGRWRAELKMEAKLRTTVSLAIFFQWELGACPRLVYEPKRNSKSHRLTE